MQQHLNIHGVRLSVESSSDAILQWLCFDFRSFLSAAEDQDRQPHGICFKVSIGRIPYEVMPATPESMQSSTFVCFDQGSKRFIDYKGAALVIYDYKTDVANVFADSEQVAYERLYLAILSRAGELLDHRGLHRIHAAGIAFNGEAYLFLLPPGGGKSTLAINLLQSAGVKLVADDTVFTHDGQVVPFAFRVGLKDRQLADQVPERYQRVVYKNKAVHKILIDPDFFAPRTVQTALPCKALYCGRWTGATEPSCRPISRMAGLRYLIRDCIVGLGLTQVVELFVTQDIGNSLGKAKILAMRLAASWRLLSKARCYELLLCRDHDKNIALIRQHIGIEHTEATDTIIDCAPDTVRR